MIFPRGRTDRESRADGYDFDGKKRRSLWKRDADGATVQAAKEEKYSASTGKFALEIREMRGEC